MCLRLVLSSILLAALAANPCFAKDGHAHHGARASAANGGGSGKGAGRNGASGVSPAPSNADAPTNAEAPVAPPVLPPRGVTQQQIRSINPSVKTANPGILSRSQAGAPTITAPTLRNAIGQPVVSPKNLAGAQPAVGPALRAPGATSPPILHAGPAAPPVVASGVPHANVANATNRGSVNSATVIRPATGPSVIGGPAQAHYGINGTTVQNRH
jgi:hypothetical protein